MAVWDAFSNIERNFELYEDAIYLHTGGKYAAASGTSCLIIQMGKEYVSSSKTTPQSEYLKPEQVFSRTAWTRSAFSSHHNSTIFELLPNGAMMDLNL
jgi:hypothetical protein